MYEDPIKTCNEASRAVNEGFKNGKTDEEIASDVAKIIGRPYKAEYIAKIREGRKES